MSQAGLIDIINTNPTIPTTFIADTGSAVPIANILEILGTSVPAGIVPLRTVGSGNTITIEIQRGQAFASSFSERAGIVSFDSTSFAVDANGFVTFTGGAGTVTSVSGTANRITSTGGTTPVIDISAAYVGQTSITTLGTITTGTWNGSAIGPTFGGTGQTTYATGDILYASAANVLSKLPAGANTQVLTLASGVPSWASPAAAGVTSVSGTANRITSTGGATPVIDISGTYVGQTSINTLGTITTGVWNGNAIAVTSGGTGLTSTTINQILYSSANNVIGGITAANNGTLISGTTGVPSWLANGTTGQVLTATTGSPPSWSAAFSSGISTVATQSKTATGAFTYTPTASMKYVIIELIGGGGGSGGIAVSTGVTGAISSGGAGGSYLRLLATASQIGASASGSVGIAGTAGAAGANNGGNGGNTTITISASTWTAAGGNGSVGMASSASILTVSGASANANTTGANATLIENITAQSGGPATQSPTVNNGFAGNGGDSGGGYGSGGWGGLTSTTGTNSGTAGSGFGGGGGGSSGWNTTVNVAGLAGTQGVAIFTEFI